MTKISSLVRVLFPLVAVLLCAISRCSAALSDKQLCYDANCSEVISLAKTIIAYTANDRDVMSFKVNADVKVFSKGAGQRTDLWGVEINGKRGFAPKSFLHEYKVLQRVLSHEVPVYKSIDEARVKQVESTEKVHKAHPPLKDKLSRDDNGSPLANSIDKSIQKEKVEAVKSESIEEMQEASLKDKLLHGDNRTSSSLSAKSEDKTVQEPENDADSVASSYEVVDGTTFYFENKPSVQPSFVTQTVHTTALPNEQVVSVPQTDFQTDSDNGSDKTTPDSKVLQADTENKLQEIKLPIDEETDTKVLLEGSEAIINTVDDVPSKDDEISSYNEDSEYNSESPENLQHETTLIDSSAEENTEYESKENIAEDVEDEGLIASFVKKFNILSSTREIVATESTAGQASIEASTFAPETAATSDSQLQKQISENAETNMPNSQMLDMSIGPSIITEDEEHLEIMHESTESLKASGEVKTKEEPSLNLLETVTSSSDVPSSNNFVHEDANKPANDLPIASSILANDSSTSVKVDISSHAESNKVQEASKGEKVMENIETESIISFLEKESMISNEEEVAINDTTARSSNDIQQRLPESSEKHLENTKRNDYKETIVNDDKVVAADKIPQTNLSLKETADDIVKEIPDSHTTGEKKGNTVIIDETSSPSTENIQFNEELIVHSNVNKNDNLVNDVSSDNVPMDSNEFSNDVKPNILDAEQTADSSQKREISEQTLIFNELSHNQNLPNIEDSKSENVDIDDSLENKDKILHEGYGGKISSKDEVLYKDESIIGGTNQESESKFISDHPIETEDSVCSLDHECKTENIATSESLQQKTETENEKDYMIDAMTLDHKYLKTLIYLSITAFTTLVFTLGYYYIENIRRDGKLIAKINKLEKEVLVSTKECQVLSENLKFTREKLHCIEDESFGSNEMVVSLKADLEVLQNIKAELEDQVTMLEKDLESATEAGLELERMLREVLSSNNEVNPLAKSVEDLKARLDVQQAANESLTNSLNLKAQEIETLSEDLASTKKKREELEVKLLQAQDELMTQGNLKNTMEQTLTDKVNHLETQINELSTEKSSLYKELKGKEIELRELGEILKQVNLNNLDLDKLYDVCRVKTEAVQLREERDELKTRLSDVEGAHQLLEEHMKLVKEETATLSEQCKIAEKEKKDAETRLEVLSKFFREKEAERQKEEAIWLQKQGEVVSTVERIHMMQNEIQNYKQQIEMLKREIVDQEREYKNQISALETKTHEQWVAARQNERRLEETKAEAGQLRNRLTLVEKNLNDNDSETKLHRMEANGETATSPPLFIGAESSGSPVMFSTNVPPPPPGYLHCFPPYLPPLPPTASALSPYDISQRPPPLGGRLSSPPPMPPLHPPPQPGGRYENADSPPPPLSPHLLPPYNRHRSPPIPFGSDHIPPPPPPGSILPPPIGTAHPWGEESLPPMRNSGTHPNILHLRKQRARDHKGSLHSSGELLDKAHHGKV